MVRVGRTSTPRSLYDFYTMLILHENIFDTRQPRTNKHDEEVLDDSREIPVCIRRSRDVKGNHDCILEYVSTRTQNEHRIMNATPPANMKHKSLLYGRPDLIDCIGTLSPHRVPIRVIRFGKKRSFKIIAEIISQLVELCAHSDVAGLAWRCVHCFVVSLHWGSVL